MSSRAGGNDVTVTSETPIRTLEGHFSCGSGLLVLKECLGRSYSTKTATRDLAISLPNLKQDWCEGYLDPPTWSFKDFRAADVDLDPAMSDEKFGWGTSTGFVDEPDGTQTLVYARVDRLRFETNFTAGPSQFFEARSTALGEMERWWGLITSWIEIFTGQDFVELGKSKGGMRADSIIMWVGDENDARVNPARDRNIPTYSDLADKLDHVTLTACMTLAGNGIEPPDEWLLIRDARSLQNARHYRRAVIDAGTAAELAMTTLLDRNLSSSDPAIKKALYDKYQTLNGRSQLLKKLSAGTVPERLQQELSEPRNDAAHGGASPTFDETSLAIAKAAELVEQAHPLAGLLPSSPSP